MITTYKTSWIKLQLLSLLVVVDHLWRQLNTTIDDARHFCAHVTIFKRKTGFIELGVSDDQADGQIRYHEPGHLNQPTLRANFRLANFRISNRWLARKRKIASHQLLWMIKTTVALQDSQDGGDVQSVLWGSQFVEKIELKPFDLSKLPDESVIAARLARKQRFHNLLTRWFPAAPVESGLTPRDTARSIILRD